MSEEKQIKQRGEKMEEIEKDLEEIIKDQLEYYKKTKKVPSSDVLDTINVLVNIKNCY